MAQDKVYSVITDRIIGLLDRGIVPWRRPWRTAGGSTDPVNSRGRSYRGLNRLVLAAVAMAEGYRSNVWMTYRQAEALGGKVTPGQKGTAVIFWKQLEVADPEAKDGKRTIPMLRYFTVFNFDQTEGVTLPKALREAAAKAKDDLTVDHFEDGRCYVAEAEAIVLSMPNKPVVHERPSNRAFYRPSTDEVTVPEREQFGTIEEFYSTLFHELAHSTGHESRLNRKGSAEVSHQFGDAPYAKEELVAEMTNAFLSAEAGIDPATLDNSAAYIASWKKALQDDPKVLVQAASAAQKAADFILNRQPEQKES